MRLGRYELLYRLAKGGMGEVFVARRKGPGDIEKRVVIKRIRKHLSGDPRFVEMFLREAKVSMTLSHRNIAAVFDFGRAGSELFLAMEHIDGRDLAKALKAARSADETLSPAVVAFVGIEVCRALDYAHSSGTGDEPLVHRDLSPKNLLLSFSGEVVVADFGLAIESPDQNELGRVRGTPAYMSPEQARGESLDGRADLFALALILREMLTTRVAYAGQTPEEILAKAVAGELEPFGDGHPTELVSIIEKATALDAEDRYSTAQEMLEALDAFLISERGKGAPQPRKELRAWLRRLFDQNEDPAVAEAALAGDARELDVVTYLDDGDEAISRSFRSQSGATLASIAATVADTNASVGPENESTESGATDETAARKPWLWLVLLAAAVAAAGIGIAALLTSSSANERAVFERIDAGRLTTRSIDAAVNPPNDGPTPTDAAPSPSDDATRLRPDAPPVAVKASFGWGRVQSRPWARVAIRGTSGCPETPCRIRLPAGKHRVALVNPVTGAATSRHVTIKDSSTTDLTVTLPKPEEPTAPEPP